MRNQILPTHQSQKNRNYHQNIRKNLVQRENASEVQKMNLPPKILMILLPNKKGLVVVNQ